MKVDFDNHGGNIEKEARKLGLSTDNIIDASASLVQVYTGWIFEGPTLVPDILDGLTLQMEKHGFRNIKEAIGSEEPWK